jgi:hypothetical protein
MISSSSSSSACNTSHVHDYRSACIGFVQSSILLCCRSTKYCCSTLFNLTAVQHSLTTCNSLACCPG